jgi:putative ABC transport system permease protein
MTERDLLRLATGSFRFHKLRSALTMLGILIGIASVILLTSVGEGTRQYVLDQFSQFGTNIMAVTPGRIETSGIPGVLGATVRKLTLDDVAALSRIPEVETCTPLSYGVARVEGAGRGRDVFVVGVTRESLDVWGLAVKQGTPLPGGDPRRGPPLTLLGPTLKQELFGEENALGERVRIAGRRFLVIGVLEPKGEMLGLDLDDRAYVPVSQSMSLFNRDDLEEIHIRFAVTSETDRVAEAVRQVMLDRHRGEEDFTITTQTGMLEVFDRVLGVVNMAVGGIAGISLFVGALGILTMMWIAVNERTAEIGLAMSLGATRGQVLSLFLAEAALLSTLGGAAGVAVGIGLARLLQAFVPALPVHTPMRFVLAALAVSLAVGLASGVLPARRAAALDPIESLRAE